MQCPAWYANPDLLPMGDDGDDKYYDYEPTKFETLMESNFVYTVVTPVACFAFAFFICCCFVCCSVSPSGDYCCPATKMAAKSALRFVDCASDWLFLIFSTTQMMMDSSCNEGILYYQPDHNCCQSKSFFMGPYSGITWCSVLGGEADCVRESGYSMLGWTCMTGGSTTNCYKAAESYENWYDDDYGDDVGYDGDPNTILLPVGSVPTLEAAMRLQYMLPLVTFIVCVISTALIFVEMFCCFPCIRAENAFKDKASQTSRSGIANSQAITIIVEDIPQIILVLIYFGATTKAGVDSATGIMAALFSIILSVISVISSSCSTYDLMQPLPHVNQNARAIRGGRYEDSRV